MKTNYIDYNNMTDPIKSHLKQVFSINLQPGTVFSKDGFMKRNDFEYQDNIFQYFTPSQQDSFFSVND